MHTAQGYYKLLRKPSLKSMAGAQGAIHNTLKPKTLGWTNTQHNIQYELPKTEKTQGLNEQITQDTETKLCPKESMG